MQEQIPYLKLVNARLKALSGLFGPVAERDIIRVWPNFVEPVTRFARFDKYVKGGSIYVSTIMSGRSSSQIPTIWGNYELAICLREYDPNLLDVMATILSEGDSAALEPGSIVQFSEDEEDDVVAGLLLCHPDEKPATFKVLGHEATVLLAVGVTHREMKHSFNGQTDNLLQIMKAQGVFPYTSLDRKSVID